MYNGFFPVYCLDQGLEERVVRGIASVFPEHGAQMAVVLHVQALGLDGLGVVVGEVVAARVIGQVRHHGFGVPYPVKFLAEGYAHVGTVLHDGNDVLVLDGIAQLALAVHEDLVGVGRILFGLAVEGAAHHLLVPGDALLYVGVGALVPAAVRKAVAFVQRGVVPVGGSAHVVGHHVHIVQVLHGLGPVYVLGVALAGEGDDLGSSQGLAQLLEHQVEVLRIGGVAAGFAVCALGRILPVNVHAVQLVRVQQCLHALAEGRALGGVTGHHGEAVCVAAPAADHQAHLELGVLALEGHDLGDGGLVGLGNHDAAVTGLGVAETAVGIVDVGEERYLRQGFGVLGKVGQDDGRLADVGAVGARLSRATGSAATGSATAGIAATRIAAGGTAGTGLGGRRGNDHPLRSLRAGDRAEGKGQEKAYDDTSLHIIGCLCFSISRFRHGVPAPRLCCGRWSSPR